MQRADAASRFPNHQPAKIRVQRAWVSAMIAAAAATSASTVAAQQGSLEQREREQLLARITQSISVTPDAACGLPEVDIRDYLKGEVNRHGLIDNIYETVFSGPSEPEPTGYAALLKRTQRDTESKFARSKSISLGEEAQVGESGQAASTNFEFRISDIKAVSRVAHGLRCAARVKAGAFTFPITYQLYPNPEDADGWSARLGSIPAFTEADALANPSTFQVDYHGRLLSLQDARHQGSLDRAAAVQERQDDRQRQAAREAYANSPAGRAEALRRRQEMIAQQKSCQANGGTWGVRWDDNTIMRVEASEASGVIAVLQACYFLGR